MALTQQELEDDLDELQRAINTGALRVKYKDKEVTYRSISDMNAAKYDIEKQLGLHDGAKKRVNPIFDKGL